MLTLWGRPSSGRTQKVLWTLSVVMHLIRLPEHQRDPLELDKACRAFHNSLQIMEQQLSRTRYICGERFTYDDIALGLRVHRWVLFDQQSPRLPNVERWYAEIKARPAFQKWTADPAHHLEG